MGNAGSTKSPYENHVLESHSNHVHGCAFSPKEPLLASASEDSKVRLWHEDEGQWKLGQELEGHSSGVSGCAFSPKEPLLASASNDHTVRLWHKDDNGRWKRGQVLKGHSDRVNGCVFSPTEPLLASASFDSTVRLWHKDNKGRWSQGQVLDGHSYSVNGCAFSLTEPLLASVSDDSTVRLWHKDNKGRWRRGQVLKGHTFYVRGCAFSPTEPLLASASADHTVRLWHKDDEGQWTQGQELKGHSFYVRGCAFSPTEPLLLASASADCTVRLWHKDDEGQWKPGQVLKGHSDFVNGCAFSPTEPLLLASASDDSTVRLWTVPQGPTPPPFSLDTLLQSPCVPSNSEDPLRQSLVKLCSLVGLEGVKYAVALFAAFMAQRGAEARLEWNNIALAGPPGTGKTTVARVLARILENASLVQGFHEMSVSDVKAGFVGQTHDKTMKFLEQHRGKVLFFDEANTLYTGGNDYGREAASAIIKFFEADRKRVQDDPQSHPTVFIVAGYEGALERGFWAADPGLKRRFPHKFIFADFNAQELAAILVLRAQSLPRLELAPEVEGSPAHAGEGGGAAADAEAGMGGTPPKPSTGSAALIDLIRPHTQEGQGSARQPPPLFSSGNGDFCNGGGMETLLQRAQHCCAAATVGNGGGARCVMTVTMADIEQGLKLMLEQPAEIVPRRVGARPAAGDDFAGRGGRGGGGGAARALHAAAGDTETKDDGGLDNEAFAQQGQEHTADEAEAVDRDVADAESRGRAEVSDQLAEYARQLGQAEERLEADARLRAAEAAAAEAAANQQAEHERQLAVALATHQAEAEAAAAAATRAAQASTTRQAALQRQLADTQRQAKGMAIALVLIMLASAIGAVLGFLGLVGASTLALVVAAVGMVVALAMLVWFCWALPWRTASGLPSWVAKLVLTWLGPWSWALLGVLTVLLMHLVKSSSTRRLDG